jgi:hypothetical protein
MRVEKVLYSQVWRYSPIIVALGRWREFKPHSKTLSQKIPKTQGKENVTLPAKVLEGVTVLIQQLHLCRGYTLSPRRVQFGKLGRNAF